MFLGALTQRTNKHHNFNQFNQIPSCSNHVGSVLNEPLSREHIQPLDLEGFRG